MQDQVTQFPHRLSRRSTLKGLAAFAFAVSEWGCAASTAPSSTPPTPTATLAPGSVIYTYHGQTQVLAVAWSPDDRHFAVVLENGNVVAGGQTVVQITRAM